MPSPARALATAAAVGATAAALGLLLMPARFVPTPEISHQDKLEHIALFATLVGLWRLAGARGGSAFLGAAAMAVATEAAQWAMGVGRTCDPTDALADLVGASLGLLAWHALGALRHRAAALR